MNGFMKLLVWQMAQILGYEGQTDLAEHSILLLVNYDTNECHPVFVGKGLERTDMGPGITWSANVDLLTSRVISEEYIAEMEIFFSEQAGRRKFEKQRYFDSVNYVSKLSNGKKWTHCIQYLFNSAESIAVIAQRLKRELPFSKSPGVFFPDVPPMAEPEQAQLLGSTPILMEMV